MIAVTPVIIEARLHLGITQAEPTTISKCTNLSTHQNPWHIYWVYTIHHQIEKFENLGVGQIVGYENAENAFFEQATFH